MTMDVEAEIRDLKRRVGELEGSFGFLTRQVQDVHRDLLGFQAKTERFQAKAEQRFEAIDRRFDGVGSHLDRLETEVRELRRDLPGIVGDAVREVMRPGKPDR